MDRRNSACDCPGGSALPDDALVQAAQAGDSAALDSLLARHYPWLLSVLTHLSRDPELASDVTQEAMFTAACQLSTLRNDSAFRPWLYTIAAHRLHSVRRWQKVRHAVSLDELLARFPWQRELASADLHIDRYGDREAVRDVLDRLSDSDRELLLLRFVAGFSGADVAQIIGVSPQTARQRIARAIRRYQQRHAVAPSGARASFEREPLA